MVWFVLGNMQEVSCILTQKRKRKKKTVLFCSMFMIPNLSNLGKSHWALWNLYPNLCKINQIESISSFRFNNLKLGSDYFTYCLPFETKWRKCRFYLRVVRIERRDFDISFNEAQYWTISAKYAIYMEYHNSVQVVRVSFVLLLNTCGWAIWQYTINKKRKGHSDRLTVLLIIYFKW